MKIRSEKGFVVAWQQNNQIMLLYIFAIMFKDSNYACPEEAENSFWYNLSFLIWCPEFNRQISTCESRTLKIPEGEYVFRNTVMKICKFNRFESLSNAEAFSHRHLFEAILSQFYVMQALNSCDLMSYKFHLSETYPVNFKFNFLINRPRCFPVCFWKTHFNNWC